MCGFMDTNDNKLKDVILELKLGSLTKDIETLAVVNVTEHGALKDSINELKIDIKEVLVNVKETNGSVAKVTKRIYEVEREDFTAQIKKLSKETGFWRTLSNNKWFAIPIGISLWAMTFKEVRDAVLNMF